MIGKLVGGYFLNWKFIQKEKHTPVSLDGKYCDGHILIRQNLV